MAHRSIANRNKIINSHNTKILQICTACLYSTNIWKHLIYVHHYKYLYRRLQSSEL